MPLNEAYGEGMDHVLLNAASKTTWLNMGFWSSSPSSPSSAEPTSAFATACEALVLRLIDFASLARPKGDTQRRRLLEVGCGCGDSLPLWVERCGFDSVAGVTSLPQQVARARQIVSELPEESRRKIEVRQGDAVVALEEDGEAAKGQWDAVVAVDCAYHFSNRSRFLLRAHTLLRPGGTLAMTDLLLPAPPSSLPTLTWLLQRVLCNLTAAPFENFLDESSYIASVRTAGFTDVTIEDITPNVFTPLADYIDGRTAEGADGVVGKMNGGSVRGRWLQYRVFARVLRWWADGRMRFVLVRATKPPIDGPVPP